MFKFILSLLLAFTFGAGTASAKNIPIPEQRKDSFSWKLELAHRLFHMTKKGEIMQPEQLKRAIVIEMTVLILKQDENFSAVPYKDTKNLWTYGYGERSNNPPKNISEKDAEDLLRKRVIEFATSLDRNVPWWTNLDVVRQSALLNMHYNMGNRLWVFEQMLTALQKGQYHKAALEILYEKGRPSGYWTDVKHRALRVAHAVRYGTLEFAENIVTNDSVTSGYTDITFTA